MFVIILIMIKKVDKHYLKLIFNFDTVRKWYKFQKKKKDLSNHCKYNTNKRLKKLLYLVKNKVPFAWFCPSYGAYFLHWWHKIEPADEAELEYKHKASASSSDYSVLSLTQLFWKAFSLFFFSFSDQIDFFNCFLCFLNLICSLSCFG